MVSTWSRGIYTILQRTGLRGRSSATTLKITSSSQQVGPPFPPLHWARPAPSPMHSKAMIPSLLWMGGSSLPLLSLRHRYQLLFPQKMCLQASSLRQMAQKAKFGCKGYGRGGDLVKKMGHPLASFSLSCRLPVVSQCPLGRWGISCSWRATGPRTVGGRDAYKVGVWKRRESSGQRQGQGDEDHWGLDQEGSWKPDPGARLWLRCETMTGSLKAPFHEGLGFVLDPSKPRPLCSMTPGPWLPPLEYSVSNFTSAP